MARSLIPGPLERRHLIEQDLDAKKAAQIAEAYLAVGRRIEAIDFLLKAEDEDKLRKMREEAVAEGDTFVLQSVSRALGEEPDRATWSRCADAAENLGKARYADTARRNAARSEG